MWARLASLVGAKPREPNGHLPWRKRHLVRWFDTWDLDPLGYHFEELKLVSRVCDTLKVTTYDNETEELVVVYVRNRPR